MATTRRQLKTMLFAVIATRQTRSYYYKHFWLFTTALTITIATVVVFRCCLSMRQWSHWNDIIASQSCVAMAPAATAAAAGYE